MGDIVAFDVFRKIARAEWDTLLFFYGVVLCVGGLGFIGYLAMASQVMYVDWGATQANVMVGVLSAIVDNIPGDVRGTHHDAGHVHGAVAAGDPDCRRRGQHAVHRLGRRRSPDGAGQGQVYLLRPPEMGTSHCARLRRQHPGPPVGERPFLLADLPSGQCSLSQAAVMRCCAPSIGTMFSSIMVIVYITRRNRNQPGLPILRRPFPNGLGQRRMDLGRRRAYVFGGGIAHRPVVRKHRAKPAAPLLRLF